MLIDATKNQGIVFRDGENVFGYCGWPSVAKDENGVLYAVWSGHRVAHICTFGKTYLSKSRDGGMTWSIPSVINDTPLDDRDAGIVCLGGNKLLVTWFVHPAEAYLTKWRDSILGANVDAGGKALLEAGLKNYEKYCERPELSGSFIRISEDGGETWGETQKIPVSAPHGPIKLSDGSLFYVGRAMYTDCIDPEATAVYKSFDGGKTWEFLSEIREASRADRTGYYEPHAVELPCGRILVAIRAQNHDGRWGPSFTVVTTFSDDGGKTWSPMTATGFCGSPPHLLLHSSGALVCVVGRREESYGERAFVSYDGGETWEDEYVLSGDADCGDLGYPASVELEDGSIFTLYYQQYAAEDRKNRSILYTRWNLK